jgi:hypothetical protein
MFADILKLKPDKLDKATIIALGFADESDFALMEEALNDVEREILWARYAEQLDNVQREIKAGRRLNRDLKFDRDWDIDYIRKPPSLEEFIEDPYWLGATLKPSQESQGLFPTWKELLLKDFDLESTIHNCVITGSLGIGKTYIMVTVLLYRLVLTTLLKNPQVFFNLGAGSRIVYNILSVTKAQVRQTAFGDAMNFMARSGYFRDECNFDPDSKYSNNQIELPGEVCLTAGSKGWHVIGGRTCSGLLWMKVTGAMKRTRTQRRTISSTKCVCVFKTASCSRPNSCLRFRSWRLRPKTSLRLQSVSSRR